MYEMLPNLLAAMQSKKYSTCPLISPATKVSQTIRTHRLLLSPISYSLNWKPCLQAAEKMTSTKQFFQVIYLFMRSTGLFFIILFLISCIVSLLLQEVRLLLSNTSLALLQGHLLAIEPEKRDNIMLNAIVNNLNQR